MDRRRLPAVHRLVALVTEHPRPVVLREARLLLEAVRAGTVPLPDDWALTLRDRVEAIRRPTLRRVINATGVVLHTNLGRAPLSPRAAAAVAELGTGYLNLELDLESGRRGERLHGVRALLAELCGTEAAVAVNNNAAGTFLTLTALAAGREVIVSRGELVEIGGSFRVPAVIAAGGARLVEVGTTNRTRVADYAAALTPATALLLRVHPSNFRITGFTEAPERAALHALARERGVPLVEDLGAGALVEGLGEPTVAEVARHADLVCFSGDKLLGGPQAGIVAGRADLVTPLRKHPLYRALRLDRLVLAALEATLRDYADGVEPPAVTMLRTPATELRARADRWTRTLRAAGLDAQTVADEGMTGGGAVPEAGLPGFVTAVRYPSADAAIVALRTADPPVIARTRDGTVRLDPRTVAPPEETALLAACLAAAGLAPNPPPSDRAP